MIVLDTTVFVYAKGADHPLRDPCRELIAAIADERIEATTTAEVIGEFVHVRARRRGRGDAAALGRAYAELLSPLINLGRDPLRRRGAAVCRCGVRRIARHRARRPRHGRGCRSPRAVVTGRPPTAPPAVTRSARLRCAGDHH
jgi:predicted nucleic acid-binding protein